MQIVHETIPRFRGRARTSLRPNSASTRHALSFIRRKASRGAGAVPPLKWVGSELRRARPYLGALVRRPRAEKQAEFLRARCRPGNRLAKNSSMPMSKAMSAGSPAAPHALSAKNWDGLFGQSPGAQRHPIFLGEWQLLSAASNDLPQSFKPYRITWIATVPTTTIPAIPASPAEIGYEWAAAPPLPLTRIQERLNRHHQAPLLDDCKHSHDNHSHPQGRNARPSFCRRFAVPPESSLLMRLS